MMILYYYLYYDYDYDYDLPSFIIVTAPLRWVAGREREREARVPGRENVRAIALSPRAQDKRDLSVVCLCLVHSFIAHPLRS